jgi:hypothetical protein
MARLTTVPEYTRVLLHRLRLTSQRCFLHAQRAAPVTGGTGSEDPEFIQEVADFRKTYLLENRWSADHYASPTYRSAALLDQTSWPPNIRISWAQGLRKTGSDGCLRYLLLLTRLDLL